MKNKEKYTLGVLIGGVHTYFPKEHIKGISEAAKENRNMQSQERNGRHRGKRNREENK